MKLRQTTPTSSPEHGFTIVEIGVIVPIMIAIALTLFEVLFLLVQSSSEESTRINLAYDKQAAMNMIESDVRLTSTFLPSPDTSVNNPHEALSSGSTWKYTGSNGIRVLLLRAYATTGNPKGADRQAIYAGDLATSACSAANIGKNDILSYDIIYFVYGGTLYRRVLTDTTTKTCDPQYQRTSCPPADTFNYN